MKKDQITDEKSSGANSEASANWKDFVRQICAIKPKALGAEKIPAQPQELSLLWSKCGAESVPKKNFEFPEVAAFLTAILCFSLLAIGRQK